MHSTSFFSKSGSPVQLAVYALVFFLCWNLENVFGVTRNYKKWRHDLINYMFILPGFLVQALIGLLFYKVLLYEQDHNYGLLQKLQLDSSFAQVAVTFIILDFNYYVYHFLMHKIKLHVEAIYIIAMLASLVYTFIYILYIYT